MFTLNKTDEELILLVNDYKEEVFTELYNRYSIKCSKFLLRMLHDANIMNYTYDDCLNEFIELLVSTVNSFKHGEGYFISYIKKAVYHRGMTIIRKNNLTHDAISHAVSLDNPIYENLTLHDMIPSQPYDDSKYDSFMSTPIHRRKHISDMTNYIVAYKALGYTIREIAYHLDISVSSVERVLKRIKTKKIKMDNDFKMD